MNINAIPQYAEMTRICGRFLQTEGYRDPTPHEIENVGCSRRAWHFLRITTPGVEYLSVKVPRYEEGSFLVY